jgi:hypothetical protein
LRREFVVKNLRVLDIRSINGEKHYIIQSLDGNENPTNSKDFDEAEIKRIMKKEASKPLLLLRTE